MKKFLCLLMFSLFLSPNYLEASPVEKRRERIQSLLHINKGCPENSSCTKEMGQLYFQFTKALEKGGDSLNKFTRKSGFPLRMWTKKKNSKKEITYDSKCFHHRKKKLIYESIKFIKNHKDLNDEKDFLKHIYMSSDKTYITSTNAIPSYTTNDTLISYIEFNDKFFEVRSLANGSFEFQLKNVKTKSPRNITCPSSLVEKFKKSLESHSNFEGVYKSHYCKEIYNLSQKKYITYITGWSCGS